MDRQLSFSLQWPPSVGCSNDKMGGVAVFQPELSAAADVLEQVVRIMRGRGWWFECCVIVLRQSAEPVQCVLLLHVVEKERGTMKPHEKDYRRSRYRKTMMNIKNERRLERKATVSHPTMLIPIRSGAADDDDDTPQEWSLLELNGELIPPPGGTSTVANTTSGTGGTRMELGSVRFASDVSQVKGHGVICTYM